MRLLLSRGKTANQRVKLYHVGQDREDFSLFKYVCVVCKPLCVCVSAYVSVCLSICTQSRCPRPEALDPLGPEFRTVVNLIAQPVCW